MSACETDNGGCDPLTTCTDDGTGASTCSLCPDGYTGSGDTQCEDIDGCASGPCYPGVECVDTPAAEDAAPFGSYTCGDCPPGLEGSGEGPGGCTDIDSCATDPPPCYVHATDPSLSVTCTDLPAPETGAVCGACPVGFKVRPCHAPFSGIALHSKS